MKFSKAKLAAGLLAASLIAPVAAQAADNELILPSLDYRTGPYAPGGIPYANGYADFFTMLNERDGGINGVKAKVVPCETGYNTKKGVECYEKTKNVGSGALAYLPLSTGITYQLIPKVTADKIPLVTIGYGRTSARNGEVFEYVFNPPATYWDGATVAIKHVIDSEGGADKLKGKKIALVYHNSAYGKEPIRTLEALAEKMGFELTLLPVDHPGQEQKATWLQVRRNRPDWVLMWGWGVMNQVAIKEAASIRFPMDKFVGVWWSGGENDVLPAGKDAHGYKSVVFTAVGADFPAHADIKTYVYGGGKAVDAAFEPRIGETHYNRGVYAGAVVSEAIRKAMADNDTKTPTGPMMQKAFEGLEISDARWAELGLPNFTGAVKLSCADHRGPSKIALQQWDANAKKWSIITDFVEPMDDVTTPLIKADSEAYAKENNIAVRDCK
ncbi:ABC transporter substrate-binding protein [Cohaesibacter gelatinilyticus]|uniref:Amino acid/amide ABC transporter substrate-binding protein, HAAT family n=1 Tax=Cohaesibacter gelatinilyticus TaxID=372072 RepID=A0A285PC08_9HYPH|nr:ABC transporter substrate-binding protein [Cohaesibacter gelatinilyticus]SNZ18978.1 amino acid/amide ABC transporter substrate-binding protein, HAAT family [Cohaesibacter gelatinilyticus]